MQAPRALHLKRNRVTFAPMLKFAAKKTITTKKTRPGVFGLRAC